MAFVRKKTRNQVFKQHFNTRLKNDNTYVFVLKEIPVRILSEKRVFSLGKDSISMGQNRRCF